MGGKMEEKTKRQMEHIYLVGMGKCCDSDW